MTGEISESDMIDFMSYSNKPVKAKNASQTWCCMCRCLLLGRVDLPWSISLTFHTGSSTEDRISLG